MSSDTQRDRKIMNKMGVKENVMAIVSSREGGCAPCKCRPIGEKVGRST